LSVIDFTHEQFSGRIVFGAGRRRDAPAEIGALDPTGVLIVGGTHDSDTILGLADALAVPAETIIGVRPHVPADTVNAALALFDRFAPNVVVAVGGGSATGLGKMIALERDVTLVAIPTTYAGSEMTPIWGTTDNGVKQTGRSLRVLPRVVVYDPELTVGLPKSVTVNSAFNALAHCVEALWLPDTSPIAAEAAISAIRGITESLDDVVERLDDVDARARLLYGAHRAGSVLTAAGTGLLHKTAHVLGGMFDLDHGAMYAVLTPHMVGYHSDQNPDVDDLLTSALGADPRHALDDLAVRLNAPRSLVEIGFPVDATPTAIQAVAHHAGVSIDEIEHLLTVAISGHPTPTTPTTAADQAKHPAEHRSDPPVPADSTSQAE
jgi:maleylacetate reductase